MSWLMFLTYLIQVLILLGILGLVFYQLRHSGVKWIWMIIGVIALIPSIFLFRFYSSVMVLLWIGLCSIFLVGYIKPTLFPDFPWKQGFGLIYFSSINFLMVLWSFCTQQPMIYIWLVLITFLSGCLGITKIVFDR